MRFSLRECSHVIASKRYIVKHNSDYQQHKFYIGDKMRCKLRTHQPPRRCRKSMPHSASLPLFAAFPRPSAESTNCCKEDVFHVLMCSLRVRTEARQIHDTQRRKADCDVTRPLRTDLRITDRFERAAVTLV